MVTFAITSILLAAYFLYMTNEDAKSMTVPVLPSNILIANFFALYMAQCAIQKTIPDVIGLLVSFLMLVIFIKKKLFMGSGDAKALFITYLASPWLTPGPNPYFSFVNLNPFVPAGIYLFAAVPFLGYCIITGAKQKLPVKEIFFGKHKRCAFFPFLTAGYLSYISLVFFTHVI